MKIRMSSVVVVVFEVISDGRCGTLEFVIYTVYMGFFVQCFAPILFLHGCLGGVTVRVSDWCQAVAG